MELVEACSSAPGKAIDQVLAIFPATVFHGLLEELYHLCCRLQTASKFMKSSRFQRKRRPGCQKICEGWFLPIRKAIISGKPLELAENDGCTLPRNLGWIHLSAEIVSVSFTQLPSILGSPKHQYHGMNCGIPIFGGPLQWEVIQNSSTQLQAMETGTSLPSSKHKDCGFKYLGWTCQPS